MSAAPTTAAVGDRPQTSPRTLGLAGVAVAIIGLSAGSTMVKAVHAPGPVTAIWRLVFSGIVWHTVLLVRRERFTWEAARATALPGFLFGINLVCFFTGVTRTRIANAEFIGTLSPLIVVPVAAYLLRERIRPVVALLGGIALLGVGLIVLTADKGGTHQWSGDLLIVAAMITWSSYLLLSKKLRARISAPILMAGMTTFAALTVAPFAIATHHVTDVSRRGWMLIVLMSFTSGVICHGLFAWAQKAVPVSTISLMQLAQPGMSAFWAWLFLSEGVRPIQVVGMVIVLVAVGSIARSSTAPARNPTSG